MTGARCSCTFFCPGLGIQHSAMSSTYIYCPAARVQEATSVDSLSNDMHPMGVPPALASLCDDIMMVFIVCLCLAADSPGPGWDKRLLVYVGNGPGQSEFAIVVPF